MKIAYLPYDFSSFNVRASMSLSQRRTLRTDTYVLDCMYHPYCILPIYDTQSGVMKFDCSRGCCCCCASEIRHSQQLLRYCCACEHLRIKSTDIDGRHDDLGVHPGSVCKISHYVLAQTFRVRWRMSKTMALLIFAGLDNKK